jgi:heterodisulfide reductase subunit A-like polyferredoxin
MYGENENVVTQVELEGRIAESPDRFKSLNTLVMIQCVGSRDKENPYCSRYCCSAAVKNALKLKEINPEMNIYILYRDLRTYGFKELYYKEAREKGIHFITYDENIKPEISKGSDSAISAVVYDKGLDADLEIDADLLVLSAAIRPHPESHRIVEALKLSNDPDNFFLEAHMKLRPLDFANIGVFLCGLAHSPKLIEESISQAKGAVSRACTVLSKKEMMVGGIVSHVDADNCVACLTCIRVCPYDVPVINAEGVAEISEASCQGCGNCAAACPRKAIELYHYKDRQIISKCEVLFA